MKTVFSIILTLAIITGAWANEAYMQAMKKNVQAMKAARSKEALQDVANAFERIANRETQEWLPSYYAALAYIHMSMMEEGSAAKDATLDKARRFVDKALSLATEESEVTLLAGYWTMLRLSIDPAGRGQSLSPLAMQQIGKAMQQNPENPRAYLLMAQMEYGTAQFFGHSTERACQLAKKSSALFEKSGESDGISPDWGKESADKLASGCN
jgi:GNAT superfamily N-acetyltransferase